MTPAEAGGSIEYSIDNGTSWTGTFTAQQGANSVLVAPITLTAWDVGVMLGLKGFAAAILGGLGSGPGAVVGGLLLGVLESLGAGYVSSAYKDAIAFVVLLLVLLFLPSGLFGRRSAERV